MDHIVYATPDLQRGAKEFEQRLGVRAEHPSPAQIISMFKALGIAMQVTSASEAALVATIEGPLGKVELK